MNIGAVLIGMGAAILTAAYITAPLRHYNAASGNDAEAMIEKWIAQADRGLEAQATSQPEVAAPDLVTATGAQRFCHHCGRPVKPDHNFCPGCGTRLSE